MINIEVDVTDVGRFGLDLAKFHEKAENLDISSDKITNENFKILREKEEKGGYLEKKEKRRY